MFPEIILAIQRFVKKHKPDFLRGPWVTSGSHALLAVLGIPPFLVPGPLGIYIWYLNSDHWWLWGASMVLSSVWYTIREKRQHAWSWARFLDEGFRMFLNQGEGLTFGQRWDPVADFVFCWAAIGVVLAKIT